MNSMTLPNDRPSFVARPTLWRALAGFVTLSIIAPLVMLVISLAASPLTGERVEFNGLANSVLAFELVGTPIVLVFSLIIGTPLFLFLRHRGLLGRVQAVLAATMMSTVLALLFAERPYLLINGVMGAAAGVICGMIFWHFLQRGISAKPGPVAR